MVEVWAVVRRRRSIFENVKDKNLILTFCGGDLILWVLSGFKQLFQEMIFSLRLSNTICIFWKCRNTCARRFQEIKHTPIYKSRSIQLLHNTQFVVFLEPPPSLCSQAAPILWLRHTRKKQNKIRAKQR